MTDGTMCAASVSRRRDVPLAGCTPAAPYVNGDAVAPQPVLPWSVHVEVSVSTRRSRSSDAVPPRERRPWGRAAKDDDPAAARTLTETERAAIVEVSIEQAIRRGDFDDLPGSGKPIPGLGTHHGSDWWNFARQIETRAPPRLGPPTLTLRSEYAAPVADRIDELRTEADVHERLRGLQPAC